MKKCPFCKAEIEENARFCLYCMKPLVEKEIISPARKKLRIWSLVVVGAVICSVLLVCWLKKEPPTQPPATDTTNATSDSTGESTAPSSSSTPDPTPEPEPAPCSHSYTLTDTQAATCTAEGRGTYTCSQCGHSYQQAISPTGHRYGEATCLLPKTCDVCQQTDGEALGHDYQDGSCTRCSATDPNYEPPKSEVVYTYREAQYGDIGIANYTNDGNDIVITGVATPSPDGAYDVPSYIDGKRVLAIMPNAFRGTDAKKVVVGDTVRFIWDGALSDCVNLTDVYFTGSKLDVDAKAFPDVDQRTGTLTIHCSAACCNSNMLSYKNAAEYWYDAAYEEWDG